MTDFELMLHAWHQWLASGNAVQRDLALELADRNRERSRNRTEKDSDHERG